MTTPNNTVAGLVEKWRKEAEHMHTGPYEARILRKNAGELEAALASPAPSAPTEYMRHPSGDGTIVRKDDPSLPLSVDEILAAMRGPSAPVVDDAASVLRELRNSVQRLPGGHARLDFGTEAARKFTAALDTAIAALSGVSAPVGVECLALVPWSDFWQSQGRNDVSHDFGTFQLAEQWATACITATLTPPAAAPTASCSWSQQQEGCEWFNTGCGHEYTVLGGEDGEVDIPYCPYCARRIEISDDDSPAAAPRVECKHEWQPDKDVDGWSYCPKCDCSRRLPFDAAIQPAASEDGLPLDALGLARAFHETYERLAPMFGYETRIDTRRFDPVSANGKLMVAVCHDLIRRLAASGQGVPDGWKLVPVEPTEAMVVAALRLHGDDAFIARAPALVSALEKIYRAMLAAAPTQEGK